MGSKKIWLQMDIFMAAALAAGLPRGGEHWRAGGDGSLALIFFCGSRGPPAVVAAATLPELIGELDRLRQLNFYGFVHL